MAAKSKPEQIIFNPPLICFKDREAAANLLFEKIKGVEWVEPLVLAIPRGGVVTGAILAKKLGAELDVIIARKLRCPWSSELAIGAVAEGGRSYLTSLGEQILKENPEYLEEEITQQSEDIQNWISWLRNIKPKSPWRDRTVILTDDGIATGATFFTALEVVRAENPLELIAVVPVLPKDCLKELKSRCDKLFYLSVPEGFYAVGQFYQDFKSIGFDKVSALLSENQLSLLEKKKLPN